MRMWAFLGKQRTLERRLGPSHLSPESSLIILIPHFALFCFSLGRDMGHLSQCQLVMAFLILVRKEF